MSIEFHHVTKKYQKFTALKSLNAVLTPNHSYALLGPNGSGKTTFIKLILAMVKADEGKILVNNEEVSHGFHYRDQIGYMPQIGQYPANMTINHIIGMMKDLRNISEARLDTELLEQWELDKIGNKKASALSGGTRQKLSACLAFLFDPAILILDEPTAGLDPLSSEILKDKIIKETGKNKLIIITSHILSDLDEIITDVLYLQEGQPMFSSPVEALRQSFGEISISKIVAGYMKNKLIQHA